MKLFVLIVSGFWIYSSGYSQNVGIGITTPLTNLHIRNGASGAIPFAFSPLAVESNGHTYINLLSPAANETAILFGQPGSSANGVLMYNNSGTLNGFQFRVNGNITKMVLDGQGRLGIGYMTPQFPLSFNGTLGDKISLWTDGSSTHYGFGIQSSLFQMFSKTDLDDIAFGYGSSDSFTETMRIKGNGNIGMGTTSPEAKLHVSAVDASLALFGPNAYGGKLYVGSSNNQGAPLTAQVICTDGNLHIDPAPGKNIYIGYFQPRDVLINPNGGKVGIGKTPAYSLDVIGSTITIGNFVNTNTASLDYHGVSGSCENTPGSGIGVYGVGGSAGVYAKATLSGSGTRYGVQSIGFGGAISNYGVYGYGADGTIAYGIYGEASGNAIVWGGYFSGSVYSTGTYQGSDRKLKNDIRPLKGALTIINQLKPTSYTYKTTEYHQMHLPEGLHYGLIADEVQPIIPGVVKKAVQPPQYENHDERNGKKVSDEVEFNAVNYTEMIPILIGAVKEQQVMIEALIIKNQLIDRQQEQIELQQQQIDELKKLVEEFIEKIKD